MHNANLCNTVFLKYAGRGLYTMGGARENAVACMRYELCISRKRLLHSVFTRNASEREDVGEGVAAHVVCAVDAARDLARGVEAGDDA